VGIESSSRRPSVATEGTRPQASTQPMARHARGAWVVADNLARIEFTPDDLERLELFGTNRWRRRGEVFHDVGAGRHACLLRNETGNACHRAGDQGKAVL
jgi:hypothetical protein